MPDISSSSPVDGRGLRVIPSSSWFSPSQMSKQRSRKRSGIFLNGWETQTSVLFIVFYHQIPKKGGREKPSIILGSEAAFSAKTKSSSAQLINPGKPTGPYKPTGHTDSPRWPLWDTKGNQTREYGKEVCRRGEGWLAEVRLGTRESPQESNQVRTHIQNCQRTSFTNKQKELTKPSSQS